MFRRMLGQRPTPRLQARGSLGRQMALILLPLVLIPLLVMAAVAYNRARTILQEQVQGQMSSATETQIQLLDEWKTTREQQLVLASQRAELRDGVAQLLRLQESSTSFALARDAARTQLADLRTQSGQNLYSDVLVVRVSNGRVVAATNQAWEGLDLPAPTLAGFPAASVLTLPVYNDPFFSPAGLVLLTSIPIRTSVSAAPGAFLVGVNAGLRLGQLMEQLQVFWEQRGVYRIERGQTYLVMRPDLLIRLPRYSVEPEILTGITHPVLHTEESSQANSLEYSNLDGTAVLGTFEWIPGWQMGVVNEVPQAQIYAGLSSLAPFTAAILAGSALFTLIVVVFATNRLLRPLGTLTGFAGRVSRGDWEYRVPEDRNDELGLLANALNRMAEDLSGVYRSLEARVEERTRQIRTASEVARDAAAIRDLDRLLDTTVRLISDRFGFYHAGIFLLNEAGEWAVLKAASSEGGQRMLQRQHKLAVGKVGIVGYVTGTGKSRIALDVGADAIHFANPDLPGTRSEMALPLRIGERVIGALDVQSVEPDAFDEDDLVVLQTMADQVAVAIENTGLIQTETRRAAQRRSIIDLSRQLTQQQGLTQVLGSATEGIRLAFGYVRVTLGLVEGEEIVVRSSSASPSLRRTRLGASFPRGQGVLGRAVLQNAPLLIPDLTTDNLTRHGIVPGDPLGVLAVPLTSRGRTIGALAVERQEPASLTEDDVELLETLSGLLAVALENARLFEQTEQSLHQVDALYRQQTEVAWQELLAARMAGSVKTQFEYTQKGKDREDAPRGPGLQAPIALRGETIGSLEIETPQSTRDWSEDDREVLEAVADEVAIALEQARLMEEVHRRATQLRTAAEIARDATSLLDVDTLLRRAINLIRDRFGFYHVAVFLLDQAGEFAVLREATGEAGRQLKASGHKLAVGSKSAVGHATEARESYVVHDVSADPYHKPNPLLPETQTELVLPLLSGLRVIGALDIQHTRHHTFTENDIAVLQILADQLGIAVQNALSYEEALRRAQREEAVLDLSSKVRATRNIDIMLQTAVRELRKSMGARHATIRLAAHLDEPPGNGEEAGPLGIGRRGNGDGAVVSRPPGDKEAA